MPRSLDAAPPYEGLSKPPYGGTPYHSPPYTEEALLCLPRVLAHSRHKDPIKSRVGLYVAGSE
jgi:hypothetical protein